MYPDQVIHPGDFLPKKNCNWDRPGGGRQRWFHGGTRTSSRELRASKVRN